VALSNECPNKYLAKIKFTNWHSCENSLDNHLIVILLFIIHPTSIPTQLPNIKHRLKHSSPASNIRAAGRRLAKHAELITHKNLKLLNLMKN
jgi:hypothetical protein